jgi:hypothetical protein
LAAVPTEPFPRPPAAGLWFRLEDRGVSTSPDFRFAKTPGSCRGVNFLRAAIMGSQLRLNPVQFVHAE